MMQACLQDLVYSHFSNPFSGLNPIFGQHITRGSLLRPYPHFGNVTLNGDPSGYS